MVVSLINNKKNRYIKKCPKVLFEQYLKIIYCLKDELNELNEIKSVILKEDICNFDINLSNYKNKNTNKVMFQKAVKDLKQKIEDLKYEIIILMHKANIIKDIMIQCELQWDESFIQNREYLINIYNEICPIGIVEYIENYKIKK